MTAHEWSVGLYLLNFSLLMTHQVDSAYWEEWKLFRIPGGNQLNLLLNFLLLLIGLAGFGILVDEKPAGDVFAAIVAEVAYSPRVFIRSSCGAVTNDFGSRRRWRCWPPPPSCRPCRLWPCWLNEPA